MGATQQCMPPGLLTGVPHDPGCPVIVEPEILLAAAALVALGSFIQGALGFGSNMVAAPLLIILDADLVPGPLFVAITLLSALAAVREAPAIDWSFFNWSTGGRFPGVLVGALVLVSMSQDTLALVVAGVILVGVFLSANTFEVPINRSTKLIAGFGSGFGGITSSIGGPPLALLLQNQSGPIVRSTIGACFLGATVITVPALVLAGKLGWDEAFIGCILMPPSFLGFLASGPVRSRVDGFRMRQMILGLCAASAVAVIGRVVW